MAELAFREPVERSRRDSAAGAVSVAAAAVGAGLAGADWKREDSKGEDSAARQLVHCAGRQQGLREPQTPGIPPAS